MFEYAYNDGVREIPDRDQNRKNTISKTIQHGTEETNKGMNNDYCFNIIR